MSYERAILKMVGRIIALQIAQLHFTTQVLGCVMPNTKDFEKWNKLYEDIRKETTDFIDEMEDAINNN